MKKNSVENFQRSQSFQCISLFILGQNEPIIFKNSPRIYSFQQSTFISSAENRKSRVGRGYVIALNMSMWHLTETLSYLKM